MKYQHLIFVLLAAFAVMFLWGLEPAAASEDAQSYPAVTLSQTVDGVTVTLEAPEGALPEGTTMRVEPVDRTDVYGAVEKKFTAKGKSMSDAAAFDVTPMDKDGNEIQPLKEVKVTFRGTGLDASDQGIDVYRVSDDAKTLKKMDTSLATADEQEFGTDHFTIYVSGGSVEDPNGDGGGGNYKNHAYLLPYGEEATFCSNESSILGEEWYIHSNVETDSLTHVGGSTFKNTNNYGHDTLVVIAHSYGWGPWHGFEQFYVQPVRKKVTVTPYLKKVGDTEFKQYADPETRWAGDKKSLSFPNPDQYAVGEDSKVYTFDGWYTDEECTKKMDVVYDRWTKRPLYRFYYNTKLYGRYIEQKVDCGIVYDVNSKDCTYVPQYSVPKEEGSTVVQIRNDTADRPGYTMPTGGWSADPNATEPDPQYDAYKKIDVANDPNAKDGVLVLYAVWHVYADLQYFNDWNHFSWGKVNHSLDTIKDINQVAKEVTATPAEGYRFKEWRDSSATVVSTNPVFRPEKSKTNDGIDVYVSNRYSAYFEPIISTVTFETNGGLPIPSQAVAYNEKAVKTEAEMLEPCATFAGWYEDKELTKEFSFDQPIREDMTLYAKWERHHNTMVHVDEEAATCVRDGNIGFWACADCGRCFKDQEAQEEISKEDTIITPLGHIVVVTEETVTKPGCTAEGERHYVAKCTRCKETISESTVATPALGHNWGEWEVTEPTETEPGVKTRKCSRCDAAETKEVPVGECAHSSIIKVDKVEPGCEKQGKEEHYICEVCDALFWDAAGTQPIEDAGALGIPATGHTDRESYIAEKGEIAPTCTGTGSKLQLERCKTCGAILGLGKTVETDPLGHRWGNAEVVKPAGLDHYGLERYTCERCEETLSKPTPCTMDGAKLTLSRTAFVYNGQEQKPDIQSIGGKLFSEDVDYTAVWKDPSSLDVGAYTVTVSGKGEYTGTAKAGSYTIAPKGTSLKAPKKAKKAIKVKWKKQAEKMSKSRITGYQIMLATNSKFTKNKKTVKVKGYSKTSKKVKRLKGGKKYYIKIRTYMTVGGKTYYSAWSKVKKVKTKK